MPTKLRRVPVIAAAGALCAIAAGCGSSSSSGQPAATGSESAKKPVSDTVALDYYGNNSNFAGFYAAQANGYYAAAGLKVSIQPFTTTTSDVLVSSGKADFGTSDEPTTEIGRAAGEKITSIAAITQHYQNTIAIAPKDNNKITSPAQLEGKTYGGFGTPVETAVNDAVITAAGGKPTYKNVTLGVTSYAELDTGAIDFAQPYVTDDALWAKLAGKPWKLFNPLDYGFPDAYGHLLIANTGYLQKNPSTTKEFVKATLQGYKWAAQNPDRAVAVQIAAKVGPMNVKDMDATAELLAKSYWLPASGPIGIQSSATWSKFTAFAVKAGLLKDSSAKVITTVPDISTWYTNAYLPASS